MHRASETLIPICISDIWLKEFELYLYSKKPKISFNKCKRINLRKISTCGKTVRLGSSVYIRRYTPSDDVFGNETLKIVIYPHKHFGVLYISLEYLYYKLE